MIPVELLKRRITDTKEWLEGLEEAIADLEEQLSRKIDKKDRYIGEIIELEKAIELLETK